MFYNFTNREFTARWDKNSYTFKPFQICEGNKMLVSDDGAHSVLLTDAVAQVFAHHLATDVLNNPILDTNFEINDKGEQVPQDIKQQGTYNNASIDAMKRIALNGPSVSADMPKALEVFLKKAGVVEADEAEVVSNPIVESTAKAIEPPAAPKRRGRPKKTASPSENVEFAI